MSDERDVSDPHDGPDVTDPSAEPGRPSEPAHDEPARPPQAPPLPPLEDITFEPPPGEPPPLPPEQPSEPEPTERLGEPVPPPEPARPVAPVAPTGPRVLSARRFRTLEALADALAPARDDGLGAAALGVARAVDAALGTFGSRARRRVEHALSILEWSSLAGRYVRPLSALGPAARAGVVGRARRARVPALRRAASDLAALVLNRWAAMPEAERAIGFTYACVTDDEPRRGPALEVLSYPQIYRPHTESCDVVVVGSGAGGAVVARDLAERGLSVVVVEEGGLHGRDDFGGPPADRSHRLYRSQGLARAGDVTVCQGMGIGGSTLVSYGSAYRPPDDVLLRWENQHGIGGVDAGGMRPYFDRVERALNVTPAPDALDPPGLERIRAAARAKHLHGGAVRRTIEGCRGCGVCSAGCPSDAKLGTHLTFLPEAQRHGASIYANARAERLLIEGGRARGVVATLVDQRTRAPKTTLTVHADAVVLAAGAVHTPAILARNAVGNRSGLLGAGLSLMPTATVGGFFDEELHAWRGTQQPYAIDEWLDELGIMVEVTGPVPSLDAGALPGAGEALGARLRSIPSYAALAVSVADGGNGRVRRGRDPAADPGIAYRLAKHDAARLVKGITSATDLLLSAGAREVAVGSLDAMATAAEVSDALTTAGAHRLGLRSLAPTGGARMGADPAASVVDPHGAVHGVGGLYVADAGVLPSCPMVGPQITVMALAARTAEHVAREAGR